MSDGNLQTERHRSSPLQLLANAAGAPSVWPQKVTRLGRALRAYGPGSVATKRLDRLVEIGLVRRRPTPIQLAVGGIDMLRFWISPAAADYYAKQGINYTFHQVLRVLDDPAGMVDPIGLLSERDTIIGHIMQVVHANPLYDFQLLSMHEDGMAELQDQVEQMLRGNHPRQQSIGAIVEEPDYHAELLSAVISFRNDPTAPALLRSNIGADPHFSRLERVFGSLTTSMDYFSKLPTTLSGGLRHLATVRDFPFELAEA